MNTNNNNNKSVRTDSEITKPSLLIVEDERNTREVMAKFLRPKYNVTLAEDGLRAINILKKNNFDLLLTDLRMPGADGMAVLEAAKKKDKSPVVIVITAYGSVETAVDAMKAGAFDFIRKPVNFDRLELLLERALESKQLKKENEELKRTIEKKFGIKGIIGKSAAIQRVINLIYQIAPAKTTVLITGESGTGKELVAEALHQLSGRPGKFIPVHCAALPTNLLETELFGYEKGAFTGATEQKKGRFELADKGTLFLDEIGEVDLSVQVKLLRVLETKSFERIGGIDTITVDTRVVTATNKNLRKLVEEKKFREDLYYRLDVVTIHLPPLRERIEDIPLLINAFIREFNAENNKNIETITEDALALLTSYPWPGNIRELRNCIERMIVLSNTNVLTIDNIPLHIREHSTPGITNEIVSNNINSFDMEKHEKALIIKALEECRGNRTKAAEKLGISRRTLHRKLHSFGINFPVETRVSKQGVKKIC